MNRPSYRHLAAAAAVALLRAVGRAGDRTPAADRVRPVKPLLEMRPSGRSYGAKEM